MKRNVLIAGRLLFAAVTFIAIITQLVIHVRSGYNVVNFFSYFTNLSNLFAAGVLLFGAIQLIRHQKPSHAQDMVRGAAAVYMAVVGIVFSLLLRDVELGALLPWVNFVLHYLMPVAVVAEWIFQPSSTKLTFTHMKYWLIFPLLYLVYSLTRGAFTGFYPYPFINPAQAGGYVAVALYSLLVLIVFLVAGTLIMWISNRLQRHVRSSA